MHLPVYVNKHLSCLTYGRHSDHLAFSRVACDGRMLRKSTHKGTLLRRNSELANVVLGVFVWLLGWSRGPLVNITSVRMCGPFYQKYEFSRSIPICLYTV